jgi:hypothetical protein
LQLVKQVARLIPASTTALAFPISYIDVNEADLKRQRAEGRRQEAFMNVFGLEATTAGIKDIIPNPP